MTFDVSLTLPATWQPLPLDVGRRAAVRTMVRSAAARGAPAGAFAGRLAAVTDYAADAARRAGAFFCASRLRPGPAVATVTLQIVDGAFPVPDGVSWQALQAELPGSDVVRLPIGVAIRFIDRAAGSVQYVVPLASRWLVATFVSVPASGIAELAGESAEIVQTLDISPAGSSSPRPAANRDETGPTGR
ncbi:hypothetical protein Acel_0799 [Acidothermus cellulolyticus 11B]|uniref:Uncharacterized protein n=1 Tax=Acidothermus cellulolyticus (strain ATCC 43068 / DSM 8971 / 11B) TaxID=351607 RepID=A0LT12_ACIC1|nr:hypothetical protein [Acidothermus cellulolyticus]ABK52572.1 hypothetical protein Acel_0799 [Acidothermus cellulolyticus 11B]